jgi:hypothetical protein
VVIHRGDPLADNGFQLIDVEERVPFHVETPCVDVGTFIAGQVLQ